MFFWMADCCLHNFQVKHVHVPCTSMGPNEPHAASIGCPDGILERQDSDLLDSELERARLFEFLHSELPCHPKLHRGQLKNGLRYLILPNKVPPNRYSSCTPVWFMLFIVFARHASLRFLNTYGYFKRW